MIKQVSRKKLWTKPAICVLCIKKDTFSGSGLGAERASKAGPPTKRP
jgi:hypothetical protein